MSLQSQLPPYLRGATAGLLSAQALRGAWSGAGVFVRSQKLLKQSQRFSSDNPARSLDLIDALKAQEKADQKRRGLLSARREVLSSNVIQLAQLYHVSAGEEDADLHTAILAKEAVHLPPGGIEELREYRFGDATQNKDCQTLVIPHTSGRRLTGQIFRVHFTAATDPTGRIYVDSLIGNVDLVNSSKPTLLNGTENTIGYYSVSADFNIKAAGRAIISRQMEANLDQKFETTVSPLREIIDPEKGGYDRGELLSLPDDVIRRRVLEFISRKIDMPSRSHLGNGAFVGWVNINRDSPKDPIIVNYIYDRDLLAVNRENYSRGVIPMSASVSRFATGNFTIAPSSRISQHTSFDMAA